MANGPIEVQFPIGGLVKRYGFQQQPPFTTPNALNVRPYDALGGRERGGSRPGLVKARTIDLAGPLQAMVSMTTVDAFGNSQATLAVIAGGILSVDFVGTAQIIGGMTQISSAFNSTVSTLGICKFGSGLIIADLRSPQLFGQATLTLATGHLVGSNSENWTALGVSSTLDVAQLTGISDSFDDNFSITSVTSGYLVLTVPAISIEVVVNDNADQTLTVIGAVTGGSYTLNGGPLTGATGAIPFDADLGTMQTALQAVMPSNTTVSVALTGNSYSIEFSGVTTLTPLALASNSLTGPTTVACNYQIGRLPKLYGVPIPVGNAATPSQPSVTLTAPYYNGSIGAELVITLAGNPSSGSYVLSSTSNVGPLMSPTTTIAWNATANQVQTILQATMPNSGYGAGSVSVTSSGIAPNLVYTCIFSGGFAGNANFVSVASSTLAGQNPSGPPALSTVSTIKETYGIIPMGCPLCCVYRGRLVLAGPSHVWYMSRQGDYTDWDYGANPADPQRAVAGQVDDVSEIGDPIYALIPHGDDYLVFGCENTLWVLLGDAASGGQVNNLSREVGVVGPLAWCFLPDSSIMFLSRDGLYVLGPGATQYPQSFSRERLPQSLVDVDGVNNIVTMMFDSPFRGVHLYITPVNGTTGQHWWIDWMNKGFWPVSLPTTLQPTAVCKYGRTGSPRQVLLGCGDGYIRDYSAAATTDDGTTINSQIDFGPIRFGPPGYEGVITNLSANLAENSGSVNWAINTGRTAEQAATSGLTVALGSWAAAYNRIYYARVRGVAMVLSLTSAAQWGMESLILEARAGGRIR